MGSLTYLVHGGLELSVEPDGWLRSVLQAVGTRGVSCVFSLDRLHLACLVSRLVSQFCMLFMPSVCSSLCCLGPGSGISAGLSMSRCRLGDLIGESAGATLPAMSAKIIS